MAIPIWIFRYNLATGAIDAPDIPWYVRQSGADQCKEGCDWMPEPYRTEQIGYAWRQGYQDYDQVLPKYHHWGDIPTFFSDEPNKMVRVLLNTVPWSAEEIEDYRQAIFDFFVSEMEFEVKRREAPAARNLGYYTDAPMANVLSYLGAGGQAGADAAALNIWRGALRDHMQTAMAAGRDFIWNDDGTPDPFEAFIGAPPAPVRDAPPEQ